MRSRGALEAALGAPSAPHPTEGYGFDGNLSLARVYYICISIYLYDNIIFSIYYPGNVISGISTKYQKKIEALRHPCSNFLN